MPPFSFEATNSPNYGTATVATGPASQGHILVVDDNAINCEMLRMRLEVRGFRCTTVESGREALDLLLAEAPDIDLVLLDIMMPEMSGIEVLQRVRQKHDLTGLPIIMATAKDKSEDVVEALSSGANDYVTKPIDFPVLYARMGTHLRLQALARQRDDFLSIASHDLKNPLSVIRGFARMVSMLIPTGAPMSPEATNMLSRIVAQTHTMEGLISDFLDFEALENGQLILNYAPVDLADMVSDVFAGMETYAAGKEISLHLLPPSNEGPGAAGQAAPLVSCDADRIAQVMRNFIGNAIKFSPPGSQIEVEIGTAPSAADHFQVLVRDEGPGLTSDDATKLFVKYARLSAKPTGGEKSSGLGLAICRQMIELHGGEVTARNRADGGSGAEFVFTLPLQPAPHPASPAA